MWSYVVLRSLISNRLASSCLFLSWLVLSRLSFVFHDKRNNCELAERRRNHNTKQHRRNSNSIKNIHKKSSILGPILTQFWGLGPSWGHLGISKAPTYIPSLIFTDFVSQWGPHWGPKHHTGCHPVATEASKGVFLKYLFPFLVLSKLSCLDLSCLALPCLALPCLALSCLV